MAGSTAFFGQLLARYAGNTLAEQDAKAAQKKADRDMQLEMLLGIMNDPDQPLNRKNNATRIFIDLTGGMKEGSPERQALTKLSDKIDAGESIGGMVIDKDGDGVPDTPSQGPQEPQVSSQAQQVGQEELPVSPSFGEVPQAQVPGQAQAQAQSQAQAPAGASQEAPREFPPVPQAQQAQLAPLGQQAQPDRGILATQEDYDKKARLEAERAAEATRIEGRALLENQTAQIEAMGEIKRNQAEEDFVANVQSYRGITGEEPDRNTMLAMRGFAIKDEEVKVATFLTRGEDLTGVKNPDGGPLTDTLGQPIGPGYYRLTHDKNGVFKGAIPSVGPEGKQTKITHTDVGNGVWAQAWNMDGTPKGERIWLPKGMTPQQASKFTSAPSEDQDEVLKDYSIALSSTGTFKWSDIPIELRRPVSKYALANGYVILSPGEREDIAALNKSHVLMQKIWTELIGTRRKANGERYENVEDFMQTMDSYKADHNGNLPEGFGGVLQKAGGVWDVIKGAAGYDSGAYKVVSAISEQLSVLLARAFGDVGNIAVSEREAAKKAIAGFTDNDSAVYKLIKTFRQTVVDIRALVIEEANTVLRKKAFGTRKGEGASTQGAQGARGGIEPVPGTAGAGVSSDKNLEIISRWKTQ